VFTYENQQANPLITNPKFAQRKLFSDDKRPHFMAENDFATNGNDGNFMFQNSRWSFGTEWRLGYNDMHGYETETHLGRYIGKMQWFMPYIGIDWRYRTMGLTDHEKTLFGQTDEKDNRSNICIGFMYTLPMLVHFEAEIFTNGIVRLQLMREDIPISKRLRAGFMVNTDKEYMVELKYVLNRNIGVRTHYDSDMGFGIGMILNY
jgi:hypothetical protein